MAAASPDDGTRFHPLLAWGAIALGLLVLQAVALPDGPVPVTWDGRMLAGWNHFDGPEYLDIAARGYEQRQLVWFPLYPLLIRALDAIVTDAVLSAVLVSLAGGATATWAFWRWTDLARLTPSARRTAVAVLLVYPYAWYLYGVVYSDAVFVALCLVAFVLFERDHRGAAAAVAVAATAARPSGFALVLGLQVLALDRDGVLVHGARGPSWWRDLRLPTGLDRSSVRARTWWPMVGLVGLAAYAGYQWAEWGSPLRFASEQENYHSPGVASLLKQQYFDAWYEGFDGRHLATTTLQAAILAAVLVAVPAVGRRFGWGYGAFVFGLALLPAISVSTFMGVGRYLLPAFPAFALAGDALARRPAARVAWLALSATLMVVMAFGYSRNWYLS